MGVSMRLSSMLVSVFDEGGNSLFTQRKPAVSHWKKKGNETPRSGKKAEALFTLPPTVII